MGAGGSKSADPSGEAADASAAAVAKPGDARAPSVKDEVLGMVLDGIFLYGMFLSAKYMYKVRASAMLLRREGGSEGASKC